MGYYRLVMYYLDTYFKPNFSYCCPVFDYLETIMLKRFISCCCSYFSEKKKKEKKAGALKGYWFALVFRDKNAEFNDEIEKYLRYIELLGFAYIYHNLDHSETDHFHLLIHTKQQKTIRSISKLFKCSIYDIERVSYPLKFMRYLIHLDNEEKHQYNSFEVVTNFEEFQTVISDRVSGACDKNNIIASRFLDLLIEYNPESFKSFVCLVGARTPELLAYINKYAYFINSYIKSDHATTEKHLERKKSSRGLC